MDIACPQCAAAYELDETAIGAAGRKVRCAACGEVWRAMPAAAPDAWPAAPDEWPSDIAEPPAPLDEPETAPAPKPRLIKEAGRGQRKTGFWRGLADWRTAALAATALVVAAGLHQRQSVVALLPQTAKIYAAAGLPVNLRGVEFRNVKSRLIEDDDQPVLVVDGDLVNVAGRRIDVPRLHFAILGPDGRQIYVWSAPADRTQLQPGETLNFRRRLAAPPADAREVSVRFLTRSDITAGIK